MLLSMLSACAAGGSGGAAGSGGGAAGTAAAGVTGSAGGGGGGGTSAAGTSGTAGTGAAGANAAGATGAAGHAPTDGGVTPDAAPDGGQGGSGGSGGKVCVNRALSLSANGTGTASDAAHARVEMDLMTDLPIGAANRTIEFWMYVKPTDWVAEVNEIFVYGVGGQLKQLGLDFGMPAVKNMPGNHATLGPYTNGIYDDDTGVYLGITSASSQWVHAALTWDGTSLRTYVNGALRITTTVAGKPLATTASPFTMGCNPPYFGCFNGLVDELRIWSVARTDAEIMGAYNKALAGNETGLVGYWKFDEPAGATTAADSVTTQGHVAHPGTLLATGAALMPTFVTPDPPAPITCP